MDNYFTAMIPRSDWTDVHLGSSEAKNVDSNLTHNLNAEITGLVINLIVSTDGTGGKSFFVDPSTYTISQVDTDNVVIQTAPTGLIYMDSTGARITINTQDWFYQVRVFKLG